MKRALGLIVFAACSSGPSATTPQERAVVRLVACTPALPPPFVDAGEARAKLEQTSPQMGWGASAKPVRRAVSLSFEIPQTSAMMDPMAVRKVVAAKTPDITKCYERELATNTSNRVRVAWRFSVTQDGHVVFADPTTQALSTGTSTCISQIIRRLIFPARQTGGSMMVTFGFVFDAIPFGDRPGPSATTGESAWTPFAARGEFATRGASTVARAAENLLRNKSSKLEACFTPNALGSLRTLFAVENDGDIVAIRAGGLGNAAIESCVAKELTGVKLVNPGGDATEIACDFARGDAQPWRVTPSERYGVISATRKDMTFEQQTVVVGALEPDALPADRTYLIVADPETPGNVLANALAWANDGVAVVVALGDGAKPPRYLGMGRVAAEIDLTFLAQPVLWLARTKVYACVGKKTREGKLSEAGTLAQQLASYCKTTRCSSLVVGLDELSLAKDLVEVTGAARRAGFERVLIGQAMCGMDGDEP